jgi:predicted DNA-binding transcriptional regulator AlpA
MRAESPSSQPVASIADRILLREREAAALLAISARSLWGLRARGEIPVVRISKHCVRYRVADLEAWAAKRASTSRDPIPLIAGRRAAP